MCTCNWFSLSLSFSLPTLWLLLVFVLARILDSTHMHLWLISQKLSAGQWDYALQLHAITMSIVFFFLKKIRIEGNLLQLQLKWVADTREFFATYLSCERTYVRVNICCVKSSNDNKIIHYNSSSLNSIHMPHGLGH